MKKSLIPLFILFFSVTSIHAQQVSRAEYFFNTDPGFGLATALTVTAADSLTIVQNISIPNNLPAGINLLFARVANNLGVWSFPEVNLLWISTAAKQINSFEYFFDSDPGIGNGTRVSFTIADSINLTQNVLIPDSLKGGLHLLFVRVQNQGGTWSMPESYLLTVGNGFTNLMAAEYFWDTDPGIGLATPLSFSSPADSIIHIQNIPVPALSLGSHKLYVRTKNIKGTWSFPEVHLINICTAYGPTSKFESLVQGKTVYFSDSSKLSNTTYWNFGDGQTSTQVNPKHKYTNGGNYTVRLATSNSCGTDTLVKTVSINGIQSVYPNFGPTRGGMVFEVTGQGFDSTTKVKLHRNGITRPTGKVIFGDSSLLKVNCINDTLAMGVYDVIAITGTRRDTLQDAMTIEPNSNGLWFSVDAPPEVLINRYSKVFIRYGNTGNSVLTGIPVYISLPLNSSVLLANPLDTSDTDPSVRSLSENNSGFFDIIDSLQNISMKFGYFLIPYIEPRTENTIELEVKPTQTGIFSVKVLYTKEGLYNFTDWVDVDSVTSRQSGLDCNTDNWSPCARCALDFADLVPQLACVISTFKMACKIKAAIDAIKSKPKTLIQKGTALQSLYAAGAGIGSAFKSCVPALFPPGAILTGLRGAYNIAKGAYKAGKDAFDMSSDCLACFKDIVDSVNCRSSWDPNIKYGPLGPKQEQYVSGTQGANYSIHFENLASATAPAAEVVIKDTLDLSKFKASSFIFTGYGFGDSVYNFNCADTLFINDVDLRPNKNTIVRTTGIFEPSTGALFFKFSSFDPATMKLTTIINDGFLPPNTDTTGGQGYVSFIIQPKENLVTENVFTNIAKIIFDSNPPINTPVWNNTVDKQLPQSMVSSATHISDSTYILHITGTDNHAGIKRFNIFMAVNNGPYDIMQCTDSVDITFTGRLDSIYKFYSVAIDRVDNYEAPPSQPDLILIVDVPLPVTLVDFQAYKQDKTVLLRWETVSEQNNRGFEIQRSNDGINYQVIGWVNGAGNSSSTHNYSLIDLSPLPGRNFYRLKQIDLDGNYKLSPVRRVDFVNGIDFTIFPNPVKDILTIQFTDEQNKQIKIVDMLGRVVWSEMDSRALSLSVPVNDLAKGLYTIVITDNNGKQFVKKFVKQ